jgi:heptosyltransferase-2
MGDAVMATPALRALRTALPESRITWAGGPAALRALEGLPFRDGVMPVAGPLAKGFFAPWRASRLLRRQEADAALLLPNSFSSALAARLAGIPRIVGACGSGRRLLLTDRVDLPREGRRFAPRSMRLHYLDLVAPFGARDDGAGTELSTTRYDEERAADRRGRLSIPEGYLGVNPGAAFGPSKIYPPPLLGRAVALVRRATGRLPVVLGGPGEERLARETAEAIGPPVVSLHEDPPDLGELKALLRRAGLLVTTDAGPRHLAEAFGVPTVVVAGPTDPRWGEGGPSVVVRREELRCIACHLRECPIDHPCMRTLEPERVANAAVARLTAAPSGQ